MKPTNSSGDKDRVAFRRLLLSKQIYLHGLEHSNAAGALNKMIAIHNFHNSIEIMLRAIILHYEIRPEKQLNIDFETMLNEIDNHPSFKNVGQKLPYRKDLRNLNQMRNLVQHHGIEPATSAMGDWRAFTKSFLMKAFNEYFNENFENFSSSSLINDEKLITLMRLASSNINDSNWLEASILIKSAFEFANHSISKKLSLNRTFSGKLSHSMDSRKIDRRQWQMFQEIQINIKDLQMVTSLLMANVDIQEFRKFEDLTPQVSFYGGGKPYVQKRGECGEDNTRWSYNFVVDRIIDWQLQKLDPKVEESNVINYNHITSEFGLKDFNIQ